MVYTRVIRGPKEHVRLHAYPYTDGENKKMIMHSEDSCTRGVYVHKLKYVLIERVHQTTVRYHGYVILMSHLYIFTNIQSVGLQNK